MAKYGVFRSSDVTNINQYKENEDRKKALKEGYTNEQRLERLDVWQRVRIQNLEKNRNNA